MVVGGPGVEALQLRKGSISKQGSFCRVLGEPSTSFRRTLGKCLVSFGELSDELSASPWQRLASAFG